MSIHNKNFHVDVKKYRYFSGEKKYLIWRSAICYEKKSLHFLCLLENIKIIARFKCRVRVTDRHCRHLRRKIKFVTKNHKLVKASGEKNIA